MMLKTELTVEEANLVIAGLEFLPVNKVGVLLQRLRKDWTAQIEATTKQDDATKEVMIHP